ncbi:MAG: lysoplasmalogenase [Bacteroidota bacterium]
MPRILLLIYLLVGTVNVVGQFLGSSELNEYTKPLLMPLLIYYLYRFAEGHITLPRILLAVALIFSWGGDLLLMGSGDSYFLGGLVSFLIAQIFYAVTLFKSADHKPKIRFLYLIPLIVYGAGLLTVLLPEAGEMGPGIIVYAIGILTMVFMASIRHGYTNKGSYISVLIGALLFVLSDSMIALDKFYSPIDYARVLIMSTYIVAQLLLVRGILLHKP